MSEEKAKSEEKVSVDHTLRSEDEKSSSDTSARAPETSSRAEVAEDETDPPRDDHEPLSPHSGPFGRAEIDGSDLAEQRTPGRAAILLSLFVVAVAGVEAIAHLAQVKRALSVDDFAKAKETARALLRPNDGLLFSPEWTGPMGRSAFRELATMERSAYASIDRFPRVLEISARGRSNTNLSSWKLIENKEVGKLDLRVLENPGFVPALTDLVSMFTRSQSNVFLGGAPCAWGEGAPQTGGLGFGTAIPKEHFQCTGAFGNAVGGVSIVADMDYAPHRCVYAPPPAGGKPLRIVFRGVKMGTALVGHHGLYVEAERHLQGRPVNLRFFALSPELGEPPATEHVASEKIGLVTHIDGQSWKPFEFSTTAFAGRTIDLAAEIESDGDRRQYCFEAVTR